MSQYEQLKGDALAEHLSGYLVNSWSYSSVALFLRNPGWYEKEIIYCEKAERSAVSIAGNAYHDALAYWFECVRQKMDLPSLTSMETVAYEYLGRVPAEEWNLSKTCPTYEAGIALATKKVTALLENFMAEQEVYMEDIDEVLDVEIRLAPPKTKGAKDRSQWLTVNGVDIPLPCHAVLDLVVRTKDGKVVIVDHKSKSTYTDQEAISLVHGKQGITYVLAYEKYSGLKVDEVWFIENKDSRNKDGSPQLRKFVIPMNADTRALYELSLYQPLKKMIDAAADPDYIYVFNDADSMVNKAKYWDFWARTMLEGSESFTEIPEDKRKLIEARRQLIREIELKNVTPEQVESIKDTADRFILNDYSSTNMTNSEKIEHVLKTFGIMVRVAHEIKGYSSNTYLLEVSAGTPISKVARYAQDIASALDVASVRIARDLAVYEGRSYLSIEANHERTDNLDWDALELEGNRIPIGRDNFLNKIVWDLDNHATPHVLACGATGSGKSVCILSTIRYAMAAGITDIFVFDPKYEFIGLASEGVKVVNDMEEIEATMADLVMNMQARAKGTMDRRLTLVIFDEYADAIASSRKGKALDIKDGNGRILGTAKSLGENLQMLLQKGRSLGFRIFAATQRASVKIISGDAKVNFPVQICFRVPKAVDSEVVLDERGAECLAGKGDGLMRSPEYMDSLVRFQGYWCKG